MDELKKENEEKKVAVEKKEKRREKKKRQRRKERDIRNEVCLSLKVKQYKLSIMISLFRSIGSIISDLLLSLVQASYLNKGILLSRSLLIVVTCNMFCRLFPFSLLLSFYLLKSFDEVPVCCGIIKIVAEKGRGKETGRGE